jgi:catechol 2,3-dioxygenase-like lactoylglutathione lyase family enzyme
VARRTASLRGSAAISASPSICIADELTGGCPLDRCLLPRETVDYNRDMALDLFAGFPVKDFQMALAWYQQLFGVPPTFFATETEAVWELAEHRWVYIEQQPEHAGHAMNTILVDDFDTRLAQIAERGLEPARRETYENNVRKIAYRDPDGNEFGFGDAAP